VVLGLMVAVLLSPVDAAKLHAYRPSGDVLGWSWIRLCTPFVNLYAAGFLVGGALWSAIRFWFPAAGAVRDGARAGGTVLIALGGLLPGIGGATLVEALYVGEFAGLLAIWAGHASCAAARSAELARSSRDTTTLLGRTA
jgi:hypothetical protein